MKRFSTPCVALWRTLVIAASGWLAISMAGTAFASTKPMDMPSDTAPVLHYLLDLVNKEDGTAFDVRRIAPLMAFIQSPKGASDLYRADGSFEAPSAYYESTVRTGLQRIIDYTLDSDIPSFFFWPSSLRLARWMRVDGGDRQLASIRKANIRLKEATVLKGVEHIAITPDQNTGAYYSYDVDKLVILSPYDKGKLLITIYRQKDTSDAGKRGWVLGKDDDWNYLYSNEKGLDIKGLGGLRTYMYDSFGITVYYQADPEKDVVKCGTVSWVKAGWAGINMVRPRHIHRGLVRVAQAFTEVMENPRLPEPATLAETFSKSRDISTPTLKKYAGDYLAGLERRIESSETLSKKVGNAFNRKRLLQQMTRDELYAVLALDYLKKLLGRNPVMDSHPF